MAIEPKLEVYLSSLDKALSALSISDRADIIMEIKGHVLSTREKHPEQDLKTVLDSLGDPQVVANRYLLERGQKPVKPPRSPILKWLTIAFLGTLGIIVLSFFVLVWKFTPLISVNPNGIKLLGGSIDIHEEGENFNLKFDSKASSRFQSSAAFNGGNKSLEPQVKLIKIDFNNGAIVLEPAEKDLVWRCSYKKNVEDKPKFSAVGEVFNIDLESTDLVRCKIKLPPKVAVEVHGTNGKIDILKANTSIKANLTNGVIDIEPDTKRDYKYITSVTNGRSDAFESSDKKGALIIEASLTSGVIRER